MSAAAARVRSHRRLGIGLCLSGGGFRSSIFHLGACWRLHQAGVLAHVDLFSSVSGGSIFSGFLAHQAVAAGVQGHRGWRRWVGDLNYRGDIAEPFLKVVQTDMRTGPVLRHLLWNWAAPAFRAQALEKQIHRHVSSITLGELPEAPRFIFCATDLTHGINWEFRRQRAGSWRAGYLDANRWPLARAVAASACFPPVFGPMRIEASADAFKSSHLAKDDPVVVHLTDGGVYDNLGLEPAWKFCRTVLVSDCGAPFTFGAGRHYFGHLFRYTSVIGNQALALRKRMLFGGFREGRFDGAYWGLGQAGGSEGYPPDLVAGPISRIRTDLNGFTDSEFAVLVNHGHACANRALARRAPHLDEGPAQVEAPFPDFTDPDKARRALRASHRRFSLWR